MQSQPHWTAIGQLTDLPDGQGQYVEHAGRSLAVFRCGDKVAVLADVCPHAGAPLSGGAIEGDCVICPRHAWTFSLDTGRCPDNPAVAVQTFPTRITAGRVEVALPAQT